MTSLKEERVAKKLTQQQAAERLGISLRSYVSYENNEEKAKSAKYRFLLSELQNINRIDEEHGILSHEEIVKTCGEVFEKYKVNYCYLFGSYAKGNASETSDVDFLISADIKGLEFYGLVEILRERLHKKVDLLDFNQFMKNEDLAEEILKDGIKIYG